MSAKRNKMPLGQTEISVPPAPFAKAYLTDEDKEREYEKALGSEAASRQRQAYADAHRCSCGVGDKWPVRDHKVGCHKIPLRLGRS